MSKGPLRRRAIRDTCRKYRELRVKADGLEGYGPPIKRRNEPDEYFTTYDKVRDRGVSLPKFKCLEKQD